MRAVSVEDRSRWLMCVTVAVETSVTGGLAEPCAKPANPPAGFSPSNVWALMLSCCPDVERGWHGRRDPVCGSIYYQECCVTCYIMTEQLCRNDSNSQSGFVNPHQLINDTKFACWLMGCVLGCRTPEWECFHVILIVPLRLNLTHSLSITLHLLCSGSMSQTEPRWISPPFTKYPMSDKITSRRWLLPSPCYFCLFVFAVLPSNKYVF